MTIGHTIAHHRKQMNITQETLAQKLGVTNQAVSKWETDQACPDIHLLPALADIFDITLDELFGREPPVDHGGMPKKGLFGISFEELFDRDPPNAPRERPWKDDDTLRIVLYQGHKLLKHCPAAEKLTFAYSGPARNIDSAVSVVCGDVTGSVDAGGRISCGNVGGNADAGADIKCGNVAGSVDAGSSVRCGDVGGNVDAGGSVTCGRVEGSVDAGGTVTIEK